MKKKNTAHKSKSIIPDYLFKQIKAFHKKQNASPDILKQDEYNQENSDQLRKQREEKYK